MKGDVGKMGRRLNWGGKRENNTEVRGIRNNKDVWKSSKKSYYVCLKL